MNKYLGEKKRIGHIPRKGTKKRGGAGRIKLSLEDLQKVKAFKNSSLLSSL